MKKLLLLVAVALMAASCEKTEEHAPRRTIIDFVVQANHWIPASDNTGASWFYYTADFPEMTNYLYDNGITAAYIEIDGVQEPLPSPFPVDDNGTLYQNYITYKYAPGEITFFYTNSDFMYQPNEPGTMRFRVITLY